MEEWTSPPPAAEPSAPAPASVCWAYLVPGNQSWGPATPGSGCLYSLLLPLAPSPHPGPSPAPLALTL